MSHPLIHFFKFVLRHLVSDSLQTKAVTAETEGLVKEEHVLVDEHHRINHYTVIADLEKA